MLPWSNRHSPAELGLTLRHGYSFAPSGETLVVRGATGWDLSVVADVSSGTPPIDRLVVLLNACVSSSGSAHVTEADVWKLSLGDFHLLLAGVTRLTFGNTIGVTQACQKDGCGAPMEWPVVLSRLTDSVKPAQPEDREVFLDGREHQLLPASVHDSERIRLAAEPLAATLEKCVDPPIDPADVDAIKLVESALDHLDPLASIVFTVSCASCSVPIQITLDVPGLVRDLWRSDDLHRDNDHHLLALAYGWKPDDMLPLRPVERRRFAMTLVDRWET